tara:strand:- start:21701 stop:22249 length:549 start_codon:yes stop_codon:yes gene_type:complete
MIYLLIFFITFSFASNNEIQSFLNSKNKKVTFIFESDFHQNLKQQAQITFNSSQFKYEDSNVILFSNDIITKTYNKSNKQLFIQDSDIFFHSISIEFLNSLESYLNDNLSFKDSLTNIINFEYQNQKASIFFNKGAIDTLIINFNKNKIIAHSIHYHTAHVINEDSLYNFNLKNIDTIDLRR